MSQGFIFLILPITHKVDIIIHILQMGKLRLREVIEQPGSAGTRS